MGLAKWTPVVKNTGKNGQPVYDGEAFVKWYTGYLLEVTTHPWRLSQFLTDVDIKIYAQGAYYYKGECWRHDEMGNIAAGYATMKLWGPIFSENAMFLVEFAPFLDPVEKPKSLKEFGENAWGSWSRNAIGGFYGAIEFLKW